ncbi:glycosyltransferase family 2 protein [Jeotgalibaca caeni]|uniref:glycosyltransferase family 2 protein n=1 Tax=Jeotgalibaca caeni TaxID=3028623 RepID=UPI00237D916E|nr:glycosyltransferase family 2 protein [Jeotgalibaca caeni]MDE1548158.1 glycosyltransferase family 2 protein [Jeotgalibaca caeni]
MKKNVVSIVSPVYKAEPFIERTIRSVMNQTYKDWEYILVDDCSPDNSEQVIRALMEEDSRIKYVKLSQNEGAAVARNTGIEHAKGQFIAFIDSDDVWKPQKLERQITFMKENQYGFTYTNFELVSENEEVISPSVPLPERLDYKGLLKNTAIACSTVIIDREIIGDFRMPLVRKGQDTATWLQILRKHDYAYGLNEVLGKYRQVKGSISSNRIGALKRTWNTYYRLEKLPLPKAIYYFCFYVFNAIKRRS